MARDPLAVLHRLRGQELLDAQRQLAERLAALDRAAAAEGEASAALVREAAGAGPEVTAWLPRGLAERDRAAGLRAQAMGAADQARATLGAARLALRLVERLQAQAREGRQRAAERRLQRLLDAAGQRRD